LLAFGLAFSPGLRAQADEPPKAMTVCELLREPSKFNGKKIAIRGLYVPYEHGLYLRGEGCEMMPITKGRDWPAVISVVLSDEQMRRRGIDPGRFAAAESAITMAKLRATGARGGEAKIARVRITYVGLFETRDSFDGHPEKQADGRAVESGFGAGGAAPGQLFVDSVRDIIVEFEESASPKKP